MRVGEYYQSFFSYDECDYTLHISLGSTDTPVSTVPEPGTVLLLGTGLVGLVGYARRRR